MQNSIVICCGFRLLRTNSMSHATGCFRSFRSSSGSIHRHHYEKTKIYFLRLRRFCEFLLNVRKGGFYEGWVGTEAYCSLNQSENFRLISSTEKARLMCAVWYLLSKHHFQEVARLLVHAIHSYPMAPSWLWRVTFHVLQCCGFDKGLQLFNNALNRFLLCDENNRLLEYMLYQISKGNFENVQYCRTNKLTHRRGYSSNQVTITKEPEYAHVQRLQRLYEGLSLYGLWLNQLNALNSCEDTDEAHLVADELAEKAYHRLQEVEALIDEGHICDNFVRPLVEILKYFEESDRAYQLLLHYAEKVPENPNTLRYLCEWTAHKQKLDSSQSFQNSSSMESDAQSVGTAGVEITETHRNDSTAVHIDISSPLNSNKGCLKHRIAFSKAILPEPAPCLPDNMENLSKNELKQYLRAQHPHLSTIITCLKRGKNKDALDLSFRLLDHPSWALYNEPWRLLRRSIKSMHKNRKLLHEAWSIRQRCWTKLHFQLRNLPPAGQAVASLLKKVSKTLTLPTKQCVFDDLIGTKIYIQSRQLVSNSSHENSLVG